jgi:hypothetical protein
MQVYTPVIFLVYMKRSTLKIRKMKIKTTLTYHVSTVSGKIPSTGQVQWVTPVILSTSKVEIRKIKVPGQPGQKFQETPSQPIKVGCGGTHLSSQLLGKCKQENFSLGWPSHKCKILSEKKP